MNGTKWCPRCEATKPISEFYKNTGRADGLSGYCVLCQRASEADRAIRRRRETLAGLGGCCVRCGFADERALQIDHVNGGGKQVDPYRATMAFYRKVLTNRDQYQLLCANCNVIKRIEEGEHIGVRVYERAIPVALTMTVTTA